LKDVTKAADHVSATVIRGGGLGGCLKGGGVFTVECRDASGNLKWTAETPNLVVSAGLKEMNDRFFRGNGYTAQWFLGLYGDAFTNNPAAGDTMANHPGWTEFVSYGNATRPACVFASATNASPSIITNSASPGVFNINTPGVALVGGAFLTNSSTKGGATGVLFSAADFAAPGNRSVVNGDILSVTYTFTLDAL
jgi:hypothetical protein